MKTLYIGTAAAALVGANVEAMAQVSSSPNLPQPVVENRQLSGWMEEHFRAVGERCRISPRREDGSYVPPAVRGWPEISSRWTHNVSVASGDSTESLFSQVFMSSAGSWTALGVPIGAFGSQVSAPILYSSVSQATIGHNCLTMIAANGQGDFRLKFGPGGLEASLAAATTSTNQLSAHFYAGEIVSPFAVAMGDPRGQSVADQLNLTRLQAYLLSWAWYAHLNDPTVTLAGEQGRLALLRDLRGLAAYRVEGGSQDHLLRGAASANLNLVFVSASAQGQVDWRNRSTLETRSYSVAYWGEPGRISLPRPSEIAHRLPQMIRPGFRAVGTVAPIDTSGQFDVTWQSPDITSQLCQSPWQLVEAAGAGTSAPRLLNLTPSWDTSARMCRFTATVIPPTQIRSFDLSLNVKSALTGLGNQPAHDLVLVSSPILISDHRGNVGFEDNFIKPEVRLGRDLGSFTEHRSTYTLRENGGASVTGLDLVPPLIAVCGEREVPVRSRHLGIVRESGQSATLTVAHEIPNMLGQGIAPGGRLDCYIEGKTKMRLRIGGEREVPLSRQNITLLGPTG